MAQKILVERAFDRSYSKEELLELMRQTGGCWDAYRITHVESLLSADGRTTLCIYEAPDAESVRIANAQAQLPAVRIWAANEHDFGD